jgi:NADH-quinone oxidoreductase subunit N
MTIQEIVYKESLFVFDNISIHNVPFNINSSHFELFKPEIYLLFLTIGLMMLSVYLRKFYRKKDISIFIYILITITLLGVSLLFLTEIPNSNGIIVFNFALVIDFYTTVIKFIITLVAGLVLISSFKQVISLDMDSIEYSILVAFSVFFLLLLVSSYNMITFYLSIEGLSLLLYVLTVFPFKQASFESALKYFILGAISSGILLYGIVLLYGITGTFDFL